MTIKTYCPNDQQGLTVGQLHEALAQAMRDGRRDQVVAVWSDKEEDYVAVEAVGVPDERDRMGLDDALAVTTLWLGDGIAWNGPGI